MACSNSGAGLGMVTTRLCPVASRIMQMISCASVVLLMVFCDLSARLFKTMPTCELAGVSAREDGAAWVVVALGWSGHVNSSFASGLVQARLVGVEEAGCAKLAGWT